MSNFVIVCGLPRSGTRQFTDYINKVSGFNIQGEISERLMESVAATVHEADKAYTGTKYSAHWRQNRPVLVYSLFTLLQKGVVVDGGAAEYVGFKTPYIETYRKHLRSMILPSFRKLYWLYCVREFEDCYRSLLGMPWFNRTASSFVYKYCRSLDTAVHIRSTLSRPRENINILNLSRYAGAQDQAEWLSQKVFHSLEVEIEKEDVNALVSGTGNRNSSENRFGIGKPPSISEEDRVVFAENQRRLNRSIEKFNSAFDEDVSLVNY